MKQIKLLSLAIIAGFGLSSCETLEYMFTPSHETLTAAPTPYESHENYAVPDRAPNNEVRPIRPPENDVRPTQNDVRPLQNEVRPQQNYVRPRQNYVRPTQPYVRPERHYRVRPHQSSPVDQGKSYQYPSNANAKPSKVRKSQEPATSTTEVSPVSPSKNQGPSVPVEAPAVSGM